MSWWYFLSQRYHVSLCVKHTGGNKGMCFWEEEGRRSDSCLTSLSIPPSLSIVEIIQRYLCVYIESSCSRKEKLFFFFFSLFSSRGDTCKTCSPPPPMFFFTSKFSNPAIFWILKKQFCHHRCHFSFDWIKQWKNVGGGNSKILAPVPSFDIFVISFAMIERTERPCFDGDFIVMGMA